MIFYFGNWINRLSAQVADGAADQPEREIRYYCGERRCRQKGFRQERARSVRRNQIKLNRGKEASDNAEPGKVAPGKAEPGKAVPGKTVKRTDRSGAGCRMRNSRKCPVSTRWILP